jgi:hypothetical protein
MATKLFKDLKNCARIQGRGLVWRGGLEGGGSHPGGYPRRRRRSPLHSSKKLIPLIIFLLIIVHNLIGEELIGLKLAYGATNCRGEDLKVVNYEDWVKNNKNCW